jgi:2-C-methyl-D-erythritol 4-phosphate cytidylyltransferase
MSESTAAIVVAGGKGVRLGSGEPKAFVLLGGTPMLALSLAAFDRHPAIDTIVAVVPPEKIYAANELCTRCCRSTETIVVAGGTQRWQSVRNGIDAAGDSEWVAVHDAARPFVTADAIDAALEKRSRYQCIIAATPQTDTIRRFENDRALETIDRREVIRVATPQVFHRATLYGMLHDSSVDKGNITDEAMLFERRGIPVGIAWCDSVNFKITTPADLELAEALIEKRNAL